MKTCFFCICIVVCVVGVYGFSLTAQSSELLIKLFADPSVLISQNIHNLFAAAFLQFLVSLLAMSLWKANLRSCAGYDAGWREVAVHYGAMSIGKYAPGKVVGMFLRGALVARKKKEVAGALNATLVEQLALTHSGLVIFLGMVFTGSSLMMNCLLIIVLCVSVFAFDVIYRFFWGLFNRIKPTALPERLEVSRLVYYRNFSIMSIVWVFTGLSVYFCYQQVLGLEWSSFFGVLGASVGAYLAGFAAFFSPGGVGVREGVLAGYFTLYTDISRALLLAFLYRIICFLIDLGWWLVSAFYVKRVL